MPSNQHVTRPQRRTAANHSGTDTAAAQKYKAKNTPAWPGAACKRSCTKNSTKVAGMALAMPLSTNTASKPRNRGWPMGPARLSPTVWLLSVLALSRGAALVSRRGGAGAWCQAHKASAKLRAKAQTMAATPAPALKALALITPNSPRPSRQPTTRARCASSPPWRVPQDWCARLKQLRPKQQATKARPATAIKPSGEAGLDSNRCGKNSTPTPTSSKSAQRRDQASTSRLWRANQPSVQRPSQGSIKASPKRAASNKLPIQARGN